MQYRRARTVLLKALEGQPIFNFIFYYLFSGKKKEKEKYTTKKWEKKRLGAGPGKALPSGTKQSLVRWRGWTRDPAHGMHGRSALLPEINVGKAMDRVLLSAHLLQAEQGL